MSEIWFSSDHHFFHKNIIRYCDRPFNNINDMHKALIKKYNALVKNDDICYFIGDFAFLSKNSINKIEPIVKQFNGRKILILGNHDEGKPFTYIKYGFESVHTSLILPEDNDFILCHDPACSITNKEKYWLVGHVHDLFFRQGNCLNVGVDVWDYEPVNFNSILNIFNKEEIQWNN